MDSKVRKAFKDNLGILKTSQLKEIGLTNYEIRKLSSNNEIEKILQGYYKLSAEDISDIRLISILIPNFVLCFDSALFYYGYSDRTPNKWHIAVDKNISKALVRIDYPYLKPYFLRPNLLQEGVERVKFQDAEINIFSRERLICDCLKYEVKMDTEIFNKAIISYLKDPQKNITKLMKYAKLRSVEKKVYDKIGTWL